MESMEIGGVSISDVNLTLEGMCQELSARITEVGRCTETSEFDALLKALREVLAFAQDHGLACSIRRDDTMSANPRPDSCESRIEAEMKSRLEELRHLSECQDLDDETSEQAVEDFNDGILSIEKHTVHRICMSCGGPADYWDVTTDNDGDVTRIVYIFQDWFEGATRPLVGDDFEVAKRVLAPFCEEP